VQQIWLEGERDFFGELEPGREAGIELHANLPDGYAEGRDHLKVIATLGPTNFHVLNPSSPDQPGCAES
jgi:hypothetical protein